MNWDESSDRLLAELCKLIWSEIDEVWHQLFGPGSPRSHDNCDHLVQLKLWGELHDESLMTDLVSPKDIKEKFTRRLKENRGQNFTLESNAKIEEGIQWCDDSLDNPSISETSKATVKVLKRFRAIILSGRDYFLKCQQKKALTSRADILFGWNWSKTVGQSMVRAFSHTNSSSVRVARGVSRMDCPSSLAVNEKPPLRRNRSILFSSTEPNQWNWRSTREKHQCPRTDGELPEFREHWEAR